MKKRVGIVADDITGANDIGIMFTKKGYTSMVYRYNGELNLEVSDGIDVVIIDTDSRLDDPRIAREKVYKSTEVLKKQSCDMYHNKTCSVFRGNIGVEFDAMQDALGVRNSMVVLGFPANGRITKNGLHYVHGVLLEESQFANDPIHPMRESNLVKILSNQTTRKVGCITYEIIQKGIDVLKERISHMKDEYSYIIFDVTSQDDLKLIAEAIKNEINICGSSAIGEVLPNFWEKPDNSKSENTTKKPIKHKINDKNGVFIVAGSLTPQTIAQVEYLQKIGVPSIIFNKTAIFDQEQCNEEIEKISEYVGNVIMGGQDVLLYTAYDEDTINISNKIGHDKGLSDRDIGRRISNVFSEVANIVYEKTGFKKVVVAGGETSEAISEGLGIQNMMILDELEPGLPDMYGYNKRDEFLMVLKSGSFGTESFLKKAVEDLKRLQQG